MINVYIYLNNADIDCDKLLKVIGNITRDRLEKYNALRNSKDKENCLMAYYLLKYSLKKDFDIENINIGYNEYKKPFLVDNKEIYFNISHCKTAVGVALSDKNVGLDIQDIKYVKQSVINKVCNNQEKKIINNDNKKFIDIFCKKESYVKMIGTGLKDICDVDTICLSNKFYSFNNDDYCMCVCSDIQSEIKINYLKLNDDYQLIDNNNL